MTKHPHGIFVDAFESWGRIISGSRDAEIQWKNFGNAAREAASYVAKGFPKSDAVEALQDLALTHGLIDVRGQDTVQQVISAAFEQNDWVPDHVAKANGHDSTFQPNDTTHKGRRRKAGAEDGGLEDEIALNFATKHADNFRYIAAWNRWMKYQGAVWRPDDTLHAFDESRKLCQEAGDADAKKVAAVVTLARTDRALAATADQWDTDPELFHVPEEGST